MYIIEIAKDTFYNFKAKFFKAFSFYLLASIIDIVAIVSLFPIFQLVLTKNFESDNKIINSYFEFLNNYGLDNNILLLILIIIILFSSVRFIEYLANVIAVKYTQEVKVKIQNKTLESFKSSSIFYFVNQPLGQITNLYNREIPFVADTYRLMMITFSKVTIYLIVIALMLLNEFKLTIIALSIFLFLVVIIKSLFIKIELIANRIIEKQQTISENIVFYLSNIFSLKNTPVEESKIEDLKQNNQILARNTVDSFKIRQLFKSAIEPLFIIFIFSLIYFFSKFSNILNASFVLNLALFIRFTRYLIDIQSHYIKILNWKRYVLSKKFHDNLLEKFKINNSDKNYISRTEKINSLKFDKINININKKVIIENFSLNLNAPFALRINGPNGSGKSTIARTVTGFYQLDKGEILLNNNNLQTMNKKDLSKKIIYIDKNPFIVAGSFFKNMILDEKEFHKKIHDIENYIKILKLNDLFNEKNLFSDIIEENGRNLSSGQISKLSICRALVLEPQILILDEATSNLEESLEKDILDLLFKLKSNDKLNIIFISHKKNINFLFDKVIELKN